MSTLEGLWLGEAEHNGQTGSLLLELERRPDSGLAARLSFPTLHAWDVATVPVRRDGERLLIAGWTLERRADGTLAGYLPSFFVPVHEIPVVFHRVEALARGSQPPIEAPRARPVWTRALGAAVWAGLETAGDLLFVGDDSGRVSALEVTSGETRWSFATGAPVRARPSLLGTTLYAHSDDGHLYALDPDTGAERWRRSVGRGARVPPGTEGSRYDHYASGVGAAGGLVYLGTSPGLVLALDPTSGEERWRFVAGDTVSGTPAVDRDRVFFGSFDGLVYALDAATGQEVWRYDTGAPVVSSPALHRGLVVVGSRSYDLLALDAATGELVWKHYYWFSWVESSVVVRDGIGYVGSSDGQQLLAVDLATGEPRWSFDTHGSAWPTPAVTDDAVFIGAVGVADYWAGHQGAFLAVDRFTGAPRWQYPLERSGTASTWGFAASPTTAGELVFTADLGGTVYAFRQSG
jgi:outer membrane protein assembly factor BamB